jgi:hypothetical protein
MTSTPPTDIDDAQALRLSRRLPAPTFSFQPTPTSSASPSRSHRSATRAEPAERAVVRGIEGAPAGSVDHRGVERLPAGERPSGPRGAFWVPTNDYGDTLGCTVASSSARRASKRALVPCAPLTPARDGSPTNPE